MAKMKTASSDFEVRLKKTLQDGLKYSGIDARVSTQKVAATKLVRVFVTASKFKNLQPSERQDLVWRIVNQHFTPKNQLRISMILTLSPADGPLAFLTAS